MGIEKKRGFIINVIYYSILAVSLFAAVKWGIPLLAPFVLGFIIAYLLRWPTGFLTRKFGLKHKPVALFMVLLFYCTIGLLIGMLGIRLFAGARSLVVYMPHLYSLKIEPILADLFLGIERMVYHMDESLFAIIQGFDDQFMQWLGSFISSMSAKAVGAASNLAAAIPGLFLKLVLMIISTFFIAGDYEILVGTCMRKMGKKTAALVIQIREYVVGTLFVCIGSYFIIASLTFVELTIGLSILRVEHAVIIAALIAVFDILPVLGTGGIMIPWAIISLIRGDYSLGLGLLLVYVAITVIRNIVEPKIVGGQLGLHPVVTLASMFAGVQLLGVVGLFGFPIGLSLLRYLNDNGCIKLFKTEKE